MTEIFAFAIVAVVAWAGLCAFVLGLCKVVSPWFPFWRSFCFTLQFLWSPGRI